MRTLIALGLLLTAASRLIAQYTTMSIADVTSAVFARPGEPAQLLLSGAALLMLSVAVRRATVPTQNR